MIERTFWYKGEAIDSLNLPALNATQISHVVMFHTRSRHCHNYAACILVISELEVSFGYQRFDVLSAYATYSHPNLETRFAEDAIQLSNRRRRQNLRTAWLEFPEWIWIHSVQWREHRGRPDWRLHKVLAIHLSAVRSRGADFRVNSEAKATTTLPNTRFENARAWRSENVRWTHAAPPMGRMDMISCWYSFLTFLW